jgi:predicted DNA-binding transcriptional regulator YafY
LRGRPMKVQRRVSARARSASPSLRSPARPQLRRLFWALARLRSSRRLTATELAREFEVDVRTAYRDLDLLRDDWRVPLEFDRDRGSYRLTAPLSELPPVTLSQGELIALYFAERVLRQYRGTPFEPDLVSAFRKMQELLPDEVRVSPDSIDAYLSLDLGPINAPAAAVFRDVLSARRLRRRIVIRYRSLNSDRTTERRVHPYHVFNHRGDWYAAGWDETRGAVRIFALHRIRRCMLTTEPFDVPRDFSFRKYMADAFSIQKGGRPVDVAVRFAPRQARWIRERRWHRSARIQEALDGSLVLRLRVAETSEIRRWVLQFGSEAEVLKPASLRRAVASELAAAQHAYRHKVR